MAAPRRRSASATAASCWRTRRSPSQRSIPRKPSAPPLSDRCSSVSCRAAPPGDWHPLATLVRLPVLRELKCPATADLACKLSGSNLFLVEAVSNDSKFAHPVQVPGWLPRLRAARSASDRRSAVREAARLSGCRQCDRSAAQSLPPSPDEVSRAEVRHEAHAAPVPDSAPTPQQTPAAPATPAPAVPTTAAAPIPPATAAAPRPLQPCPAPTATPGAACPCRAAADTGRRVDSDVSCHADIRHRAPAPPPTPAAPRIADGNANPRAQPRILRRRRLRLPRRSRTPRQPHPTDVNRGESCGSSPAHPGSPRSSCSPPAAIASARWNARWT